MPELELEDKTTLIFFDEMQECVSTATSLKAFREDGRYDVICSGSLMGINYKEIESNSVGNKEDYIMYSMDFEEFLWAKGYKEEQIEDLYKCMKDLKPLSTTQYNVMMSNFRDYFQEMTIRNFKYPKLPMVQEIENMLEWLNGFQMLEL